MHSSFIWTLGLILKKIRNMDKVYAKYKIFSALGIIIVINLMIGFGLYKLLFDSKFSVDSVDLLNDVVARIMYIIVIGFQTLFLILFMTQCRYIIRDQDKITIINPLIPFLRKNINWTEFDYFVLVDEYTRYSTKEAVWIISNEKIKVRFSSAYYSNYKDLKEQIKSVNKGKLQLNQFEQLFALLGLKKIKKTAERNL
jgi:hypothetical protein